MAKVLIPLAEGFEDVEAITIVDVLRRGGVEVVTAAMGDNLAVASAHGVEMKADALFNDIAGEEYDAIVLPGGPGTEKLRASERLIGRIVRQRADGRLLAAICAAPLVLADADVLLDGYHATCYPTCQLELPCQWVDEPVVEHEGIITGQAPGSATLFALVVLQALAGEATARKVARGMVADF